MCYDFIYFCTLTANFMNLYITICLVIASYEPISKNYVDILKIFLSSHFALSLYLLCKIFYFLAKSHHNFCRLPGYSS